MEIGIGIVLFALAAVAFGYLLVSLSVPPLYGPPEKNGGAKMETPDNHKPSR
ncbi:MAG: hypothetical protein L0Y50_11280 [Beijerinckiaceae bacterium]|nr:hypothetical protein [Beijerinckiaceae bacterium]